MLNPSLGLRVLLFLAGVAVFGLPATVWAQGGPRAARLREIAANYLGGTADALSELLPGEDVDAALLDPLGGGMLDLEQSLGEAVFAVPVAGNIGYVLRAQVYHDLPIIFPSNWQIVSVLLGDETRWRMAQHTNFVVVQPGESEARTNMTVILSSGELLQIDLEEVTGSLGRNRTGRAYIGPEPWLLERIFALMPRDVRNGMVSSIRDGEVPISQLLADPVATIRAHTDFDALPPPDDGRWDRVRAHAAGVLTTTREDPALLAEAAPDGPADAEPAVDSVPPPDSAPLASTDDADPASPEAPAARLVPLPPLDPALDVPGALPRPPGAVPSVDPSPPVALPPPPSATLPAFPRSPSSAPGAGPGVRDVIVPEGEPVPAPSPPADGVGPPFRLFGMPDLGASRFAPDWAQPVRLLTASMIPEDPVFDPDNAADVFARAYSSGQLDVPFVRIAGGPQDDFQGVLTYPGRQQDDPFVARRLADEQRFVSADDLRLLEAQLLSARSALDFARRSAGDRIAQRTLDIDRRLADLREHYPASLQFSLLLDPDVPPYTAPFYYLGAWHDGEYTYWRLLADDVSFVDMRNERPLIADRLDDFLYRLDGVVEHGAVVVGGASSSPRFLLWRRRRELESP